MGGADKKVTRPVVGSRKAGLNDIDQFAGFVNRQYGRSEIAFVERHQGVGVGLACRLVENSIFKVAEAFGRQCRF